MVFILTSQKIEIAKSANEPRLRGLFAEDATAEAPLRAEKFGALNIETIDDARSWHKILPLSGLNRIRARQKNFSGDRKEFKKVSRAVGKKPKVFCTYNSLEFGISCEDISWNHRTSTPHRSDTNGIAERAERSLDEKWSADFPWNATSICEIFKISWKTGKHFLKGEFGEPF